MIMMMMMTMVVIQMMVIFYVLPLLMPGEKKTRFKAPLTGNFNECITTSLSADKYGYMFVTLEMILTLLD